MREPTYVFDYVAQGETLERYILDRGRCAFIMGPLGSGKTNASCYRLFSLMCEQAPNRSGVRKTRWLAVRNTYPDLMGTTVKDWLEMCGDLGKFSQGNLEPPTHSLLFDLEDGTTVQAEVVFMALDREEHVRKLRGTQITGAWLNEVKELPKHVLDMLDLRHGRYPGLDDGGPTWHGMFGDTNAPDTDHWYYLAAETDPVEGWTFYRQPGGVIRDGFDDNRHVKWRVNPHAENLAVLEQLSPGYYEKGMAKKSDEWIATNLANEYGFVSSGRPVYPDYRDFSHCAKFEIQPHFGIYVGMDFGLTPAAIFAQRLPSGAWRKRSEIVTEDCTIQAFAELVKYELQTRYDNFEVLGIYGDPAGDGRFAGDGQTAIQICKAAGLPVKPAKSNDPTLRIETVAAQFRRQIDGAPAMLIHPECLTLRRAYGGGYCYERVQVVGDLRWKDKPKKDRFSHIADADQYLMLGAGEGVSVTLNRHRPLVVNRPRRARTEWDYYGDKS